MSLPVCIQRSLPVSPSSPLSQPVASEEVPMLDEPAPPAAAGEDEGPPAADVGDAAAAGDDENASVHSASMQAEGETMAVEETMAVKAPVEEAVAVDEVCVCEREREERG